MDRFSGEERRVGVSNEGEICTQQSDPLQGVSVTATKLGASVYPDPIDSNSLLFLAGATANAWNNLLARMGCTGSCQTLLAVATVVAAPEAAEAEIAAEGAASNAATWDAAAAVSGGVETGEISRSENRVLSCTGIGG